MTTKADDEILAQLILSIFPKFLYLSEEEKHKVLVPVVKMEKKTLRKQFPSKKEQVYLLRVAQGTPPWEDGRKGQVGGSSAAIFLGLNEYTNNQEWWLCESGRAPQKIMYTEDFFAISRGHVFEDFSFHLYRLVSGSLCFNAGMLFHYNSPTFSISPDGITLSTANTFVPNIHCKNDKSYGMIEIKNPVFGPYLTKIMTALVKADYVPQLMLQMDHFGATHDDFISTHLANEKCPPMCVQEYYCPEAYERKRKYLICDSVITRVFSNKEFVEQLMQIIEEQLSHLNKPDNYIYDVQRLLNDGKPLRFRKRDSEDIWLFGTKNLCIGNNSQEEENENDEDEKDEPEIEWERLSELKDYFKIVSVPGRIDIYEIQFHDTMSSSKWMQLKLVFPPKLISGPPDTLPEITYLPLYRIRIYTTVLSSTEPLQEGTGEVNGEQSVEIERYTQNQPQRATIHELMDKKDNKRFIDAQTWEKETLERNKGTYPEHVNNQVFQDLMKQHNMSLEESIKHFVLTYLKI